MEEYVFRVERLETPPISGARTIICENGKTYMIIGEYISSDLYNQLEQIADKLINTFHPTGIEIRLRDVKTLQD